VALEEVLVDGDVLDAHGALAPLHLDDLVDQQEGVAVGDDLLYFGAAQGGGQGVEVGAGFRLVGHRVSFVGY
jgi:hypothetical protein